MDVREVGHESTGEEGEGNIDEGRGRTAIGVDLDSAAL